MRNEKKERQKSCVMKMLSEAAAARAMERTCGGAASHFLYPHSAGGKTSFFPAATAAALLAP